MFPPNDRSNAHVNRLTAVLALALLLPTLAPATVKLTWPWTHTVRFVPGSTEIAGLPIRKIDPSWVRASALRDLEMPREAEVRGESVTDHGGSFSLRHDFDSDGVAETAIVGVYSDQAGETGRFLLILSDSATHRSRLRAKFMVPGEPGFSFLRLDDASSSGESASNAMCSGSCSSRAGSFSFDSSLARTADRPNNNFGSVTLRFVLLRPRSAVPQP